MKKVKAKMEDMVGHEARNAGRSEVNPQSMGHVVGQFNPRGSPCTLGETSTRSRVLESDQERIYEKVKQVQAKSS